MLYTFGNSIFKPEDIFTIEEKDVITTIKCSEKNKWLIEDIRNCEDPEKRDNLKKKLPYFCISRFSESKDRDFFIEAGGFILDIDKINFVEHYKEKLSKIPLIRFIFISPKGNGLKVGIHTDKLIRSPKAYSVAYREFVKIFEKKTGLKCDDTPDCSRACFISYDSDCYYNPDSTLWKVKEYKETKINKTVNVQDLDKIKNLTINHTVDIYNDWIRCLMALKPYGAEGYEVAKLISRNEKQLEKKWVTIPDVNEVTLGSVVHILKGG